MWQNQRGWWKSITKMQAKHIAAADQRYDFLYLEYICCRGQNLILKHRQTGNMFTFRICVENRIDHTQNDKGKTNPQNSTQFYTHTHTHIQNWNTEKTTKRRKRNRSPYKALQFTANTMDKNWFYFEHSYFFPVSMHIGLVCPGLVLLCTAQPSSAQLTCIRNFGAVAVVSFCSIQTDFFLLSPVHLLDLNILFVCFCCCPWFNPPSVHSTIYIYIVVWFGSCFPSCIRAFHFLFDTHSMYYAQTHTFILVKLNALQETRKKTTFFSPSSSASSSFICCYSKTNFHFLEFFLFIPFDE